MNNYMEEAKAIRASISGLAEGASDETLIDNKAAFPYWNGDGVSYSVDDKVQYIGRLYRVIQSHKSQPDWTPTFAVSLFAEVLIPDPHDIPEWVQPESTNPYMKGDKVKHNGKIWQSEIDDNVWEPGVYGWAEVSDTSAD